MNPSMYGISDYDYGSVEINPRTIKDLEIILSRYGRPNQVKETIKRISATNKNWADFVKDYPYGMCIDAYAIRSIVEKYYDNLLHPPPPRTRSINEHGRIESEVGLHSQPRPPSGGKRKSRRSRKGKKSRKNRRKSKRCR